jgi:hypothetical protein
LYALTEFARAKAKCKLLVGQPQRAPNLCEQSEQINLCCETAPYKHQATYKGNKIGWYVYIFQKIIKIQKLTYNM